MRKFSRIGKILIAIVLSFFVSQFLLREVFVAHSPRIRPGVISYLTKKFSDSVGNLIARKQPAQPSDLDKISFLKNNLQPIAKGVYAKSEGGYSYMEYRLGEVEWVRIELTLSNGKKITVEYPKGTEPPPPQIFENE